MTVTSDRQAGRVLVFVVAYDAAKHIRSVFERVPKDLINNPRVDFICIDDASPDQGEGPRQLAAWIDEHGATNVTVLRNPVNQGYGGNQKLGYRIAIEGGYDFVILLHGDGQYAPELLGEFIEHWETSDAQVVLGSRMALKGGARKGGMPFYKWIGNRLLTGYQNWLTGLGLSEYHTGYRGYDVAFLRGVPFETNTNLFHFDTEILLQAAHLRAPIVEFPIPTHYGDEVCHVPGIKYAKDVVFATLQFKLHQVGMLCSLKYRDLRSERYRDKTQMVYSSHRQALKIVEKHRPARVLDIGCGPGHVAQHCRELGASVVGIDLEPPLPDTMDRFEQVDLETQPLPVDAFDHDMVLMLDIIEHLRDPERFLLELRNRSHALDGERSPRVVISTPNIAFAAIRLNLLLGRFTYAERGILDITHKRLFTRRTLKHMLRDCGYTVEAIRPVPVPFEAVMPGWKGRLLGACAAALAWTWPTMFAFQFIAECRPLPGVDQILRQSERVHVAGLASIGTGESRDGSPGGESRQSPVPSSD